MEKSIGRRIRCRDQFVAQRISRVRRAIYAFSSMLFCLTVPVIFVFMGFESTLAMKVVEGLMSFAELMAILYLGAGVIDGIDIGSHIKRRWYTHGPTDMTGYMGEAGYYNEMQGPYYPNGSYQNGPYSPPRSDMTDHGGPV